MSNPQSLTISDYLQITNLAFEWANSYDTKNWSRLENILTPSCILDFRSLKQALHSNLTPTSFSNILQDTIGDEKLKTQHLLGVGKWEIEEGKVKVEWQIRVKHVRFADEAFREVVSKGHAYGSTRHVYRRVGDEGDEEWKLEGVEPRLVWSEYDLFGTLHPGSGDLS